jgi:hypothetical protein
MKEGKRKLKTSSQRKKTISINNQLRPRAVGIIFQEGKNKCHRVIFIIS